MKIAIPVERFEGEDSPISQHFGRAPIFAIVNIAKDGKVENIEPISNTGSHFGGRGAALELVLGLNVDAIIVKGMGPRALQAFQENGVSVLTGEVNTVKEALDAYVKGQLLNLTEPCKEAGHQPTLTEASMYRGRMGGYGLGPGGECVCPRCGYRIPHIRGSPCFQIRCPQCGSFMTRYR